MKKQSPILFIALGLFGVYCIEFGVVGILPMIMERFDISSAKAGMLVGIFGLIIAFSGPWMVLFFSKFNRKYVLVLCLVIFSISSLLSAYLPTFELLLSSRIVPAFFHPVYFSLAIVTATSLYPKGKSAQATTKALIGTSMGMVLGIPLTTLIAGQFSYEASFVFCAVVNALSALGVAIVLPNPQKQQKLSYMSQLRILKKRNLWLNIGAATFIFAAMFSVYSYCAQFLGEVTGINGTLLSIMLILFGIGGLLGNIVYGIFMGKNKVRTVFLHPLILVSIYVLLYIFGYSFMTMTILIVLWGAAHTSGLVVAQIWVTSEALEAPDFATALYISFINFGVTIGSSVGGWFIIQTGIKGVLWSGILFAALALVCIIARNIALQKIKSNHVSIR